MKKYIVNNTEYTEFETKEECRRWGIEHYGEWSKVYNQANQVWDNLWGKHHGITEFDLWLAEFYQAIKFYCGYGYKEINNFMRKNENKQLQLCGMMAAIIQMNICSTPLIKENIVTYRLVSDDFIEQIKTNQKNKEPTIDKGFLSTSFLKEYIIKDELDYGHHKNMLKLYLNSFAYGIYIPSVVMNREDEQEMLFDSDAYIDPIRTPYRDLQSGKIIHECMLSYNKNTVFINSFR